MRSSGIFRDHNILAAVFTSKEDGVYIGIEDGRLERLDFRASMKSTEIGRLRDERVCVAMTRGPRSTILCLLKSYHHLSLVEFSPETNALLNISDDGMFSSQAHCYGMVELEDGFVAIVTGRHTTTEPLKVSILDIRGDGYRWMNSFPLQVSPSLRAILPRYTLLFCDDPAAASISVYHDWMIERLF
jgi:hypothetical protein